MALFKKLNENYRRIGINVVSLGLVQVTNLLLPLITFPYLVRVIGVEKYGTINYALTIMLYMISITEYGFGLSATREVSLNRNDTSRLSSIFTSVLCTRILLLVIVSFLLFITIPFNIRLSREPLLYVTGIIYVLGNVLQPNWFFQGIEQMKYLTFFNLFSKILIFLLIVFFIKEEKDYIYTILIYGVANVITGLIGFSIAKRIANLNIQFPKISVVIKELRQGWSFFSMNLSALLFSSSTLIILGMFVSDAELGKYSVAEKITFLVSQLLIVVSQATYPHLCQLSEQSHDALAKFVKRLTLGMATGIFLLCLIMCVFSNEIIYLLSGRYQPDIASILVILSFHGFIVCFIHPLYQTLIVYKQQQYAARLFNWMVVISILITTILCKIYGVYGAAIASLITQALTVISLFLLIEIKFKQYSLIKA